MIRNSKDHRVSKVFKRKPWQRIRESPKTRIAGEVLRGEITLRAASTKYSIHRTTLYKALHKVQVNGLINDVPGPCKKDVNLCMNEKQLERTSAQEIKELTEELKKR
mgnify:CR=1 FL=1